MPIDLGGIVTGITTGASPALRARLGSDGPDAIADRAQQLAQPHPAILERLGVDTRYLSASRDWREIELRDGVYEDEFGIQRKAAIGGDGLLVPGRLRFTQRAPTIDRMGDRVALERVFGDRITFWGGFDQQKVLPSGTPEQVREETRWLVDAFMPGGRFVFAAGHDDIQAIFDTVHEHRDRMARTDRGGAARRTLPPRVPTRTGTTVRWGLVE